MKHFSFVLAAALMALVSFAHAESAADYHGYAVQITGKMTVQTGSTNFVTKPFTNDSLLAAVSGTVGIPANQLKLVLISSKADLRRNRVMVARTNGELLMTALDISLASHLVKDVPGTPETLRSAMTVVATIPALLPLGSGYGSGKALIKLNPSPVVSGFNFRFFLLGQTPSSATSLVEAKMVSGARVAISDVTP